MIEQLKQRPKTINRENVSHVNSWWDKTLIKNSHKIERQLKRFQKDNLLLQTNKFSKNNIDYNEYLNFSNKILEFWIQKEKKIVEEIRIVQKMSKLLMTFGEQCGILANIQSIDEYFTTIDKQTVENKKELAIEIGNKSIMLVYDAYKKSVLNSVKDDQILKEKLKNLYSTEQVTSTELFNPIENLKILFKFINVAFRNERITKQQFSQLYFNTIFLNSYLTRFLSLYTRFIMQIK